MDLSIGAPNIPPAKHILEVISQEALKPENYVYAISDQKQLLEAADWYKRRYGVLLDAHTEMKYQKRLPRQQNL